MVSLFAPRVLLPQGWAHDVRLTIDDQGVIAEITPDARPAPADRQLQGQVLLPAPANLHSHAFQRAMAGMTERLGNAADGDSFWTWRELMYRFLERLSPDDVEAIAAFVHMELLEAGYAAVAEFHYLHHGPDGTAYADPAELAARIAAAADQSGIGLTLLPVLYSQGGCDGRPLEGGQRRFGNDLDGFTRLVEGSERALKRLAADARLGLAPHSLRAVHPDDVTALVALRPGVPFHIHAAEQLAEVDEVRHHLGARPVEWLLARQPVDASWCLIHATHLAPAEVTDLAASGAVAGLCPLTEANLGDGIFAAQPYLRAEGRFGIGSDSHIRIALADELRQLETNQRLQHHARNVLAAPPRSTGRTLFEAACAGGAQALGRASGRLAAGQLADLLALDGEHPHLVGLDGDALLDAWLLAGTDRLVQNVWSAGRPLVEAGRHHARAAISKRYAATVRALRADL
ncbi:MAG: formimidoylglutamate deiminase [Geminicoccaceae bacterium]|nr:MAG: formimidoylglutamate deiminase [Geminicoccaceae bacterium]